MSDLAAIMLSVACVFNTVSCVTLVRWLSRLDKRVLELEHPWLKDRL